MSRSSSAEGRRAQTEPIAALVAVAAVCVALSVYAGYVADAMPGASDRAVEDATLERVWAAIGADGVYDPATEVETLVDATDLPDGYVVSVTVTTMGENGTVTVPEAARFDPDGGAADGSRPDDPGTASRPVAVAVGPGDVRGGRLTVEVWR